MKFIKLQDVRVSVNHICGYYSNGNTVVMYTDMNTLPQLNPNLIFNYESEVEANKVIVALDSILKPTSVESLLRVD